MTAAARFYARLEPLAAGDDGTLQDLTTAFMAPVEVAEVSRDTDTLTAWESLFDPDTCPADLLDWLAVYNGVILPPSALTAADKRYRIKQAAGRYRGTPRAIVEGLQSILTDTKTVYLAFFTPDEWTFTVGTIPGEAPFDVVLVDDAIFAQMPAGMTYTRVTVGTWMWFVLAPTLIGSRAMVGGEDTYVINTPQYPTWQSVVSHFSTWQHLTDNNPDL